MIAENLNICSKFEFIHLDLTNLRTAEFSEPVDKHVNLSLSLKLFRFGVARFSNDHSAKSGPHHGQRSQTPPSYSRHHFDIVHLAP